MLYVRGSYSVEKLNFARKIQGQIPGELPNNRNSSIALPNIQTIEREKTHHQKIKKKVEKSPHLVMISLVSQPCEIFKNLKVIP